MSRTRLCPVCKQRHIPVTSKRCAECEHARNLKRSFRGNALYRRSRTLTLAEELVCWICGKPARADDPLTADHVVARSHGGSDRRENLRAAHLSCNSRRGAATSDGGGGDRGRANIAHLGDPLSGSKKRDRGSDGDAEAPLVA